MDFNNSKPVKKLRIIFLVMGLGLLFAVAGLIFFSLFTAGVLLAAFFLLAMLLIAILNFQYVRITIDNQKIILRYYSIFAVDRMFRMFEFPIGQLHKVEVRKYLLGLKWELRLTVRVKKGLADYPWISLSAIPFRIRARLINALNEMVPQKPLR